MNVHEYQAAAILSRYGVPVNRGEVAMTPDEVAEIASRFGGVVAVKSQVHTGGRGKAGGIAKRSAGAFPCSDGLTRHDPRLSRSAAIDECS